LGYDPHQLAKRALAYVEAMPPAVSGKGGHNTTFAVARALIHGFGLPESDAWPILCAYNERCLPPWSERELRHKLADAGTLARPAKKKGHLAWAGPQLQVAWPSPGQPLLGTLLPSHTRNANPARNKLPRRQRQTWPIPS